MRIAIRHTETLTFASPSLGSIQIVRMTPKDHVGQYICEWSVHTDIDAQLDQSEDAFGNVVSTFSTGSAISELNVTAVGEVETEQNHGIVRGLKGDVPLGVFQRDDVSDSQRGLVRLMANELVKPGEKPLDLMHALNGLLHSAVEEPKQSASQANGAQQQSQSSSEAPEVRSDKLHKALHDGDGVDKDDILPLFIATARQIGLAARAVSGYRHPAESPSGTPAPADSQSISFWAETFIEGLGWVGFDPVRNDCPSVDSVRLASAPSLTAIAPMRAAPYGGTHAILSRSVNVEKADSE